MVAIVFALHSGDAGLLHQSSLSASIISWENCWCLSPKNIESVSTRAQCDSNSKLPLNFSDPGLVKLTANALKIEPSLEKKELPILETIIFKGGLLVSGRVGGDFRLFRCWCCLDGWSLNFCGLFWGDDSKSPIKNRPFFTNPVTYFIFPQDLKSQQENLQPKCFQDFFGKATQILQHVFLLGGFNPFEKYDNQIGSFPQVKSEHKKILEEENGTLRWLLSFALLRGSGYLVSG